MLEFPWRITALIKNRKAQSDFRKAKLQLKKLGTIVHDKIMRIIIFRIAVVVVGGGGGAATINNK